MRRLSSIAFVAVCLMGTSSLALAADAMQESGKLYGDQREPKNRADAEMHEGGKLYGDQIEPKNRADALMKQGGKLYGDQREPSPSGSAMKEQKKEHKEKMKTH